MKTSALNLRQEQEITYDDAMKQEMHQIEPPLHEHGNMINATTKINMPIHVPGNNGSVLLQRLTLLG